MTKFTMAAQVCLFSLVVAFPRSGSTAEPTAADILDSMRNAYSNLTSYSDSGTLDTTVKAGIPGYVLKKPFTITFKKPDLIKVEWTSSFGGIEDPHVLWSGKNGTFTYNRLLNQTQKHDSLAIAASTWTGVSGGSVRNVPSMLIAIVKDVPFSDLADLKKGDDAAIDKIECYLVSGTRRGQPITLLIGKDDFLLRKITASTQSGDIVETHNNIKTNVEMKDDAASFVPPKDAEEVERFSYKKLKK